MSIVAIPELPASSGERKPLWLVNAPIDLLIGCGLWTLPILVATTLVDRSGIIAVSALFYFLTIFCNNPHYMATIYRAYGTSADFRKYRFFTVYLTAIIALTGVVVHFAPVLVPILFTVYITWSPWRYTAQNYGIGMMFARRGGAHLSRLVRHAVYLSFLASYLMWFLMLHSTFADNPYIVSLGISPSIASIGSIICLAVFLMGMLFGAGALVAKHGFGRMLPFLALFPTQMFWFVFPLLFQRMNMAEATPIYFSTGALAFMHCAQYLWITQFYARREKSGESPWLVWSNARYYGLMILGGIALFLPGPWLLSRAFSFNLMDSYLIFVALVNIHHFMLDGAIWKLRDGRIARFLLGSANGGTSEQAGVARATYSWITGSSPVARSLKYFAIAAIAVLAVIDQAQYVYTSDAAGDTRIARILNPNDSRVWQAEIRRHMEQGDREAAKEALDRTLSLHGLNPHLRRLMGNYLLEEGDFEQAWLHFMQTESLVPPDLPTLINVGVLSIQRGDSIAGRERLKLALQRDPERLDARLNLAESLFAEGIYTDAAIEFSEFLNRSANKSPQRRDELASAMYRLGVSLSRIGRVDDAARFLDAAAALATAEGMHPTAAAASNDLAVLHRQQRNFTAAVAASRRAIHLAETHAQATLPVYLYEYAGILLDGRGMKTHALALMLDAKESLSGLEPAVARIVSNEIDRLRAEMDPEELAAVSNSKDELIREALTFNPSARR